MAGKWDPHYDARIEYSCDIYQIDASQLQEDIQKSKSEILSLLNDDPEIIEKINQKYNVNLND